MLERVQSKKCLIHLESFSSIFFWWGERRGESPCHKSKKINYFTQYQPFKMDVLSCLKFLFQENDFLRRRPLQRNFNRGMWSQRKQNYHINILELSAVKIMIFTFTKGKSTISIHPQMDNKTALSYLMEIGLSITNKF